MKYFDEKEIFITQVAGKSQKYLDVVYEEKKNGRVFSVYSVIKDFSESAPHGAIIVSMWEEDPIDREIDWSFILPSQNERVGNVIGVFKELKAAFFAEADWREVFKLAVGITTT